MPVEFLSDDEAAAYGRNAGVPTRAELEKMFFLDDADRKLIGRRRGDQHRLGFALQLTTARFVGRFLPDPLEVPAEVIDYLADQLGVTDVSQIKQYTERRQTQFDHQDEIKKAYGLREFSAVEAEFTAWVDARAWNTGDGKKSISVDGVSWLRTNKVLLPGVPHRRMVDLARYGMTATATTLRRHGPSRQLATLLATVIYLEGKSVDDCLDLLDLLMTTELIGKAETATDKERARQHPKLARHSATLAVAVETLLEVTEYGEELRLEQVWEAIDAMVPRRELKEAVAAVTGMVPPPDADADGQMRALLAERIATVSGFLKTLTAVIEFGANAEAQRVLAAMKTLPRLLDGRKKKVTEDDIDVALVTGSWRRLVFRAGSHGSTVDKNAYTMCVLTQFHRHLKRRDVYAEASARWRDPRGQLLDGADWAAAKGPALTDLQLPEHPETLLAEHALVLHLALRDVAARLGTEGVDVTVDQEGRLHVARLQAMPEPPSLVDLRKRVAGMLPRVDLPELLLEVMGRVPAFEAAFTSVAGGVSKLADFTSR
ncbi:DUF4158 domain-containing protein [Nonomuraea sp. NPDC049750]|uniref:DUF4158 domain-containing protein n=1 Tax=Nonomuraea sp. NPDC049750 TaxID=3154738 RepID=UPI0033DE2258